MEYVIQSDYEAEKAVQRIAKAQKERDRLLDIAKMERAEIAAKEEEINLMFETLYKAEIEWLTQFMDNVETKQTKTQEKYKLLSGEIIRIKPQKVIQPDREKLMQNRMLDKYIEYTPNFKWGEYKKTLKVADNGKIVNEDGEIIEIDGLEVIEKAAEVRIKF